MKMAYLKLDRKVEDKPLIEYPHMWTAPRYSILQTIKRNWIQVTAPLLNEEFNRSNAHLAPNGNITPIGSQIKPGVVEQYQLQIQLASVDPTTEQSPSGHFTGPVDPYNQASYYETEEIVLPNGASNPIGQVNQIEIDPTPDAVWQHPNPPEQTELIISQHGTGYDDRIAVAPDALFDPSALSSSTYTGSHQAYRSPSTPQLSEIQLTNALNHNSPPPQSPTNTIGISGQNLQSSPIPTPIAAAPTSIEVAAAPPSVVTQPLNSATPINLDMNTMVDRERGTIVIPCLSTSGCPNTIEITHTVTLKCLPLDDRIAVPPTPTVQSPALGVHAQGLPGPDAAMFPLIPCPSLKSAPSYFATVNVVPNPSQARYSKDLSSQRSRVGKERLLTRSSAISQASSQPTMGDEMYHYTTDTQHVTQAYSALRAEEEQDPESAGKEWLTTESNKENTSCCKSKSKHKEKEEDPDEETSCYCCFRRRKKSKQITEPVEEAEVRVTTVDQLYIDPDNPISNEHPPSRNASEITVPQNSSMKVSPVKMECPVEFIPIVTESATTSPDDVILPAVTDTAPPSDPAMRAETGKSLKIVRFEQSTDYVETKEETQTPSVHDPDPIVPDLPVEKQSIDYTAVNYNPIVSPASVDPPNDINEVMESVPEDDSLPGNKCCSCCGPLSGNRSSARSKDNRSSSPAAGIQSPQSGTAPIQPTSPMYTTAPFPMYASPLAPCLCGQSPELRPTTHQYPPVPEAPLPTDPNTNPTLSLPKETGQAGHLSTNCCFCFNALSFYLQHMMSPCFQSCCPARMCAICDSNVAMNPSCRPCMCNIQPCCSQAQSGKHSKPYKRSTGLSCCRQNTQQPGATYPVQPPMTCPYYATG